MDKKPLARLVLSLSRLIWIRPIVQSMRMRWSATRARIRMCNASASKPVESKARHYCRRPTINNDPGVMLFGRNRTEPGFTIDRSAVDRLWSVLHETLPGNGQRIAQKTSAMDALMHRASTSDLPRPSIQIPTTHDGRSKAPTLHPSNHPHTNRQPCRRRPNRWACCGGSGSAARPISPPSAAGAGSPTRRGACVT